MKKEKTVKTYKRRTKSGKVVTVRQHTAKYDASEGIKESLKKKGSGEEFKTIKDTTYALYDDMGFTKEEFAEWYEGTGSDLDKKVEGVLKKLLGRKQYDKLNDLAANNYRKGGANSFFKKNVASTHKENNTLAQHVSSYIAKKRDHVGADTLAKAYASGDKKF